MYFALVLQPERLECTYGDVPNVGYESTDAAEVFELEEGDWDLLDRDFVDAAFEACGALLDYGDVDYVDASRCARLQSWLQLRLENPCSPRLRLLYEKLLEFSRRAQQLGTGVVIEL